MTMYYLYMKTKGICRIVDYSENENDMKRLLKKLRFEYDYPLWIERRG